MTVESTSLVDDRRKSFVLQEIQPGSLGLTDGLASTRAAFREETVLPIPPITDSEMSAYAGRLCSSSYGRQVG